MPDPESRPVVGLDGQPYRQPEAAIAAMFEETNAQARKRVAREEIEEEEAAKAAAEEEAAE